MSKKLLSLTGLLLILALAFLIYRWVKVPETLLDRNEAINIAKQKMALIRLEDVSPGAYDNEDKLDKLKAIADYLHSEGVPFQVSVIPEYRDPKKNVVISLGDQDNPQVLAFIQTIQYLREQGGIIGLHGYTHQYQAEITGNGFEFMGKGNSQFAQAAYAEERIQKAMALMNKAGLPVDYWETPHYTATMDQYKVIGNYFGLIYDPNPLDKTIKGISSWDSTGSDNRSVIYVPAPLLNVNADKDVGRILGQLDKNDPVMLASFFYHPYQEFKFMYKMQAPEGYSFYAYEPSSYLHRLISGFKERGYKFVSVNDIIGFLPAQRLTGLSSSNSNILLTGDFDGDGHADVLAGDSAAGSWLVTRSQFDCAFPRNNQQSFGKPAEWLNSWGQGGNKGFYVGDFNGDGLKDLVSWEADSGDLQVALSDAEKFVPQRPWGTFNPGDGVQLLTGDFNGDGKDDLLFWNQGQNIASVVISNGKKFTSPDTWLKNLQQGDNLISPLAGDFNGDGKKDLALIESETGNVDVALSSGSRFVLPRENQGGLTRIDGFVTGGGWQFVAGDFTGEGVDNLAAYDGTQGRWQFAYPVGKQFVVKSGSLTFGKDPSGKVLIGDFNGDKKLDLAVQRHFAGSEAPVDILLSVQ